MIGDLGGSAIAPAGLIFYKSDGDECGGLVLAKAGATNANLMILDYSNSEAIASISFIFFQPSCGRDSYVEPPPYGWRFHDGPEVC